MAKIAQSIEWATRPYAFLERCAADIGDRFTIDLGTYGAFVIVSSPDDVREVFRADPAVLHAGEGNEVLRRFLGDHSLLLLEEEAHRLAEVGARAATERHHAVDAVVLRLAPRRVGNLGRDVGAGAGEDRHRVRRPPQRLEVIHPQSDEANTTGLKDRTAREGGMLQCGMGQWHAIPSRIRLERSLNHLSGSLKDLTSCQ